MSDCEQDLTPPPSPPRKRTRGDHGIVMTKRQDPWNVADRMMNDDSEDEETGVEEEDPEWNGEVESQTGESDEETAGSGSEFEDDEDDDDDDDD